ncbi:MAG: hypothetical protein NTW54_08770 [Bacteroidetes bacterium]|nr:hypothetical protein [Bacteroidota bacterium]
MKSVKVILITVFLFLGNAIYAQVNNPTKDEQEEEVAKTLEDTTVHSIDWNAIKPNLVFGGNLGLSYYAPFTLFEISPQVGYKVRENTIVGVGLQLFGVTSKGNSYFQYGPDIFVRQHLLNLFFAQAQFEYINFENYILPGKRIWNPGFLVGFGYGTYGYSLGLFTDVVRTKNSEYIYPGQIYLGGLPLFFRGQIFF